MAVILCVAIVIALIVALDAFGVLHRADDDFKDVRAHERRMRKLGNIHGSDK